MNERIVIGPQNYLLETVAVRLEGKGKDLSSFAAVFPGKRPAHFLRKMLSQRLGGSFIPPKIFSVDEFIISLYQTLCPGTVNDLETIDAVTLLYQVHNRLKERLGGDYFISLDSFIPVGIKLFGELEELKLARLPERKLKETLSSLTYNRLFSLPEYFSGFYKSVSERKYSTRASRYTTVAENIHNINLDGYSELIIAGPFKQTNAEKTIFDGLSERPNVCFIYQTDKIENGTQVPEIDFSKASDAHGQVFALSAIIKNEMEKNGYIDEKSVIVLPTSTTLFPLVHQTLSLLPQEDYNIALGYPMTRTPIYGFLHNLMQLLISKQGKSYSAAHYIKFLLHPYTKNIRFHHRTDVTRILVHAIETMLMENSTNILIAPEDIEENGELFTKVASVISEPEAEVLPGQLKEHLKKIHAKTIGALEQVGTLKEFAQKNIELLTYIYEQSTARMHPLFRPYVESMLQTFICIEESIAGTISLGDMNGYFNFLRHYLIHQNVPFTGTPLRGLQVIGLLETRGLHFDNVYLLNANDNVLPGDSGSDMLLPQQLREKLGLETRRDQDEMSEHYFNLLVRSAKRVHIFYEESGENSKSRFIERLLWETQKLEGTFSSDPDIKAARYKVKLAGNKVLPAVKSDNTLAALNRFTYSASALDSYLRCQIQFYYRYILRLDEKEELADEPDNKDIGIFVHDVLAEFYRPFTGKQLETRDLDADRMDELVDRKFAQKFGQVPTGGTFLLKRQILKRLRSFLTDHQQKVLDNGGIRINGIEEKYSINALDSKFSGKIDRIEERGDSIVILDYKTGAEPKKAQIDLDKLDLDDRETWSKAVTSLQLPVYLLLFNIQTKITPERIIPAYLYLGDNSIGTDSEVVFVEDGSERVKCFEQIKELIRRIVLEIHDQALPFSSPAELDKVCPFCPFAALCGTKWVRK